MSIAVIAGLGNPGLKYRNTRHNIGFQAVEKMVSKLGSSWKTEARFEAETAVAEYQGQKLLFVKPQTFMNSSGRSLGAVLRYRRVEAASLLVIYDDITLDLGRVKLSQKGSGGGHNGVADTIAQVGLDFFRYRIGIGAKSDKSMDLANYVLSKFTKDEQSLLADRCLDGVEHLKLILDQGADQAMNFINQRTANPHERND